MTLPAVDSESSGTNALMFMPTELVRDNPFEENRMSAEYEGQQRPGKSSSRQKGDSSHQENQLEDMKAAEITRLRAAVNAQMLLSQERERLNRGMAGSKANQERLSSSTAMSRVSPIDEEDTLPASLRAAFASPSPFGEPTLASSESGKTVRADPMPTPGHTARTPSYPFPSMKWPNLNNMSHRPFTALSPTVHPRNFEAGNFYSRDSLVSGGSTPASTLTFQPSGGTPMDDQSEFPSPNLYDLTLMLGAEPGLDGWWATVVGIMREVYKAERVTLAVPADSTDIENVPWGQKATFNIREEDNLSLTYLPRGSSMVASTAETTESSPGSEAYHAEEVASPAVQQGQARPGLASRHSFTSYEETKKVPDVETESNRLPVSRPSHLFRSKSHLSSQPDRGLRNVTLQNAPLNSQTLEEHLARENADLPGGWEVPETASRGRVFPVLQALDYEADHLIDSSGILRVLARGRVIALTRDYPYCEPKDGPSEGQSVQRPRAPNSEDSPVLTEKTDSTKIPGVPTHAFRTSSYVVGSKLSRSSSRATRKQRAKDCSISAANHENDEIDPPRRYEEYEQAPPSPWAQSPAPSPAIRHDPAENPFFTQSIDEESFNPTRTPQDYTSVRQVEAIGIDRSWTVLHIPLTHPLLSKPVQSSRLDSAVAESKMTRNIGGSTVDTTQIPGKEQEREKKIPIAILSILTSIIPYPSNLRHSLEHLASHLATTFSLCRHYTDLETQVAGLSRKRPQPSGFGALAHRGPENNHSMFSGFEDQMGRSMTSPSENSGFSRSYAGSPSTPSWGEMGSVGMVMEKRAVGVSPNVSTATEGYFTPKTGKAVAVRTDHPVTGPREPSKDDSSTEARYHNRLRVDDKGNTTEGNREFGHKADKESDPSLVEADAPVSLTPKFRISPEQTSSEPVSGPSEVCDAALSRPPAEQVLSPRRQAMRTSSTQCAPRGDRSHTLLHSYGADFGSTFQSLPASSNAAASAKANSQPRSHSTSSSAMPVDMPPPSDRLKGLMLDSLPAHVFVALPQTGEIVWVNSRYLTYRGQTVPQLYEDPWASIHPDERDDYLKAWSHAIRTGEQFSVQVRIRRFDGTYRWFYTRAVGSRDTRGVIVQWYGSHMDIHDQHIAELKAARQEEIEASEAKHRLLANLIPQVIFAATEDEGVTFANEQWLSYTGQKYEDALGLGFIDFVHPEDIAKCQMPPPNRSATPIQTPDSGHTKHSSYASSDSKSSTSTSASTARTDATIRGANQPMSRRNSSGSESVYELPTADLSALAKKGVIKVTNDSNGRLSYTTEVRLRSKSGEYRWHLVRCVEIDNISFGSGNGSWFGACTDINDHKLVETKMKEAVESKSKFLSNMSHEIRTPLIGISGMVSFLQDTILNEEQADFVNTIQTSSNGLLMIINDILDMSKVDAGMMKLKYEWFHTRSLIEDVNELVSTMAITKKLELNYVIDDGVPAMVKGDKVRMRQVLLNVIGNAVKFTTEGEVFSSCRVYKDENEFLGENEVMLQFSVVDTGRGFTKEEAEMIFKPFSQIDGSSTRQHGGSGLGLVISRQLVELHGGKMEGHAVLGKGSTFTFTCKFTLPTEEDHPETAETPQPSASTSTTPSVSQSTLSSEISTRASKQVGGNPMLANKLLRSPAPLSPTRTDTSFDSPAVASSASSDPSLRSIRTFLSDKSSGSSLSHGLTHFSEAAKVSGQDLSTMKLSLPEKSPSNSTTSTGAAENSASRSDSQSSRSSSARNFRPPMCSILVICPQKRSRQATKQHIEMILPEHIPVKITPIASVDEARELIGGADPVIFTHIILNLSSAEEIIHLMHLMLGSSSLPHTSIVILSDPVQRQMIMKLAGKYDFDQLAKDNRVIFIYKPMKPSKFAVIFDPDKEQDLSTDRNRSSAQQQVASQKQNYLDVKKKIGHKGFRVLLVEDNLVNRKVLLKYLGKVGIDVDVAVDGVECTEQVFSQPHGYFSLILCDLHMPRKDGYETCREIRKWEEEGNHRLIPIIALSANVMADVLDRCVEAGFNDYVTKPVDFKALSQAMSDLLDPPDPSKSPDLMRRRH